MDLTAQNGGVGPLISVLVLGQSRENQPVRQTYCLIRTSAGARRVWTGPQLRANHLVAINDPVDIKIDGAVKDIYGVWSEASTSTVITATDFTTGTRRVSIASASNDERLVEAPGLLFPDFSIGTGQISIHKTLIGSGFYDETRRYKMAAKRAAFSIKLDQMDEYQQQLLTKFVRDLNGPFKPFRFEFPNRITDQLENYIVRFRDAQTVDQLAEVNYYSAEFTLVELTEPIRGQVI